MPRKPNPGWFKKGLDIRRHPLSKLDCQKGYMVAVLMHKQPGPVRVWLWNKIKGHYQARKAARRAAAG